MEVPPASPQCDVASKTSSDLLENCGPVLVLPYDILNIRIFFHRGRDCCSEEDRVCLVPL